MGAMENVTLQAMDDSMHQLAELVPALAALPRLEALKLTWDCADRETLAALNTLRALRELSLDLTFDQDLAAAPPPAAFPQPLRSCLYGGVQQVAGA